MPLFSVAIYAFDAAPISAATDAATNSAVSSLLNALAITV
jgi:hypothetical protein